MNGHDAFQIYNAVRLHFTTDKFDYFTYNGKTRITAESFNARKDKYTFHKVSRVIKEDDMPYFFAVNFMKGDGKSWISSMLQEDASKNFKEWQHWQENRLINLEKDLKKLKGKFEKLIICKNGQFPELLNFVFQDEIAYDSLVILDHYIKLMDAWNTKIEDDFIWADFYKKFNKYKPFFLHYAPLSDPFFKKAIKDGLTLQK